MLPYKLIYHPGYDLHLGSHVFLSKKFRLLRERLIYEGFAGFQDFDEPAAASDHQIRMVHDAGWVERLRQDALRSAERILLEIPWSPQTREAFWLAGGGALQPSLSGLRLWGCPILRRRGKHPGSDPAPQGQPREMLRLSPSRRPRIWNRRKNTRMPQISINSKRRSLEA